MFEQGAMAPLWSLIVMGVVIFLMSHFLRNDAQTGEASGGDADKDIPRLPEKAGASLPPTVTLTPVGGMDVFAGLPLAVMVEETLAGASGMKPAGDFTVGGFPGLSIRAYTHPDKSLVGILYRDADGHAWLNLLTECADGRVVTTSSAPEEMVTRDRPKGMPLFNHPGFEPRLLLRRHKLSIRATELKPATPPERFPEFFAEVYNKLRDHMETTSKEEGNRGFFGVRISFPTPFGASEPSESGADPADPTPAVLHKWLSAAYRAANVPPQKRREFMERLVWVMDGARMEAIARAISRYSTVSVVKTGETWSVRDDSGSQTAFDPEALTGPALFDKINSTLPASARFNRLDAGIKNVIFYSRASF